MSDEQGVSIELARSLDSDMGVLTGGGATETFSERMDDALREDLEWLFELVELMQEPPK